MKRRWLRIAATAVVGAAAPHVSSDDGRVRSVASAAVAVGALFMRRPQDLIYDIIPPYPLGNGKPPARPSPQDPPKY